MKYKLVIDTCYKKYVKERSKSKEHLIAVAERLSLKHPRWKMFIVNNETMV